MCKCKCNVLLQRSRIVLKYKVERFDDLLTGLSSFLDWSRSPKKYQKQLQNIGVESPKKEYKNKI